MFGFVKAYMPELKVRESEAYKAVYCTLCRELGQSYGIFSRFILSYDFTFLALLTLSTAPACTGFEQKRCTFNPLKKCNYCKNTGNLLTPVSAAAVIMAYYKLLDNIVDDGILKKIACTIIRPFFAFPHKKAAKNFPLLESCAKEYIKAQKNIEASKAASFDAAAEPTAKAMSVIFSQCAKSNDDRRIMERLGYMAGKWVYLIDALFDQKSDEKSGNYNVLNEIGGDAARTRLTALLNSCVAEMGNTAALFSTNRYKEIINNIIYYGLPDMQKQVTKGRY